MNDLLATVDELRRMSSQELAKVGEASLLLRIRQQAAEARARHGPISPRNLETFLSDRESVRHPTRLLLEYGEMGVHQFAQPELDYRTPGGYIIYLRPLLGQRPDLIALAVSYVIPVINYGDLMADHHCLAYGSVLMGLDEEAYYQRLCDLADFAGAEQRYENVPEA